MPAHALFMKTSCDVLCHGLRLCGSQLGQEYFLQCCQPPQAMAGTYTSMHVHGIRTSSHWHLPISNSAPAVSLFGSSVMSGGVFKLFISSLGNTAKTNWSSG